MTKKIKKHGIAFHSIKLKIKIQEIRKIFQEVVKATKIKKKWFVMRKFMILMDTDIKD